MRRTKPDIDERIQGQTRCTGCHQLVQFTVWQCIDIAENPHLKAELLRGELNVSQCSNCGTRGLVETPLCYYDEEAKNLFRIVYPESWSDAEESQEIRLFEEQARKWMVRTGLTGRFWPISDESRLFGLNALFREVALEEGYHSALVGVETWLRILIDTLYQTAQTVGLEAASEQLVQQHFEKIDVLFFRGLERLIDRLDRSGDEEGLAYFATAHHELERLWLVVLVRSLCHLSLDGAIKSMRTLLEEKLAGCDVDMLDQIQAELEYIRFTNSHDDQLLFDEAFQVAYCCLHGLPKIRTGLLAHRLLSIDTDAETRAMELLRRLPNKIGSEEMELLVQQHQGLINQNLFDTYDALVRKFHETGRVGLAQKIEHFAQYLLHYLRSGQRPGDYQSILANELLAARTREERLQIAKANRHLLDKDFVIAILTNVGQPRYDQVPSGSQKIIDICLELAEFLDEAETIAICNVSRAMFLKESGQLQEAIELWTNAEHMLARLPPSVWLYLAHLGLSEAHHQSSHYSQAYHHALKAHQVSRQLPDGDSFQVPALMRLAVSERELRRLGDARRHCLEGLDLCDATESPELYADLLDSLGSIEYETGNIEAARDRHLEAAAIHRRLGMARDLAVDLNNLASAERELGALDQSVARCEESMSLAASVNAWDTYYSSMYKLARAEIRRGNLEKSQSLLEEATLRSKHLSAPTSLMHTLLALVETQAYAQQFDGAYESLQLALSIARRVGIREDQVLELWVQTAILSEDLAEARARLAQLQALGTGARQVVNRFDELALLGMIEFADRRWPEAIEHFSAILDSSPENMSLAEQATIWYYLGTAQMFTVDPKASHHSLLKAQSHARRAGLTYIESAVLKSLGALYQSMAEAGLTPEENLSTAINVWEEALHLHETSAPSAFVDNMEERLGFVGFHQTDYFIAKMALAQCSLDRVQDAFLTCEKGKSRAFLQSLGRSDVVPWSQIPPSRWREEQFLLNRIKSLTARLRTCSPKERTHLLEERSAAQDRLAALWAALSQQSEEYVSMRRGLPIGYKEVRNLLA